MIFLYCFCIYKNGKQILSKKKEKIWKEARERYQILSEEEKENSAKKTWDQY